MPISPEGLSEADLKILSNVEEYGWHVVLIIPQGEVPSWAFTIGLTHSYGHPEVCLFGLPRDTAHAVLNIAGGQVRSGEKMESGDFNSELLVDLDCQLRTVSPKWHGPFFGTMGWYYEGAPVEMLQIFWPDRENRLPWHPEVHPGYFEIQPHLHLETPPPSLFDPCMEPHQTKEESDD